MEKELLDMTLEELWELFPIFLTEHKEEWADCYYEEENMLVKGLSDYGQVRISHIGSTAICGIWAKPIIDILVEIPVSADMKAVAVEFENMGYIKMSEQNGRISFNKGYTKNGFAEKVYHVHLRYSGDNDELYFRDYMNEHEECAREYEKLKLSLFKRYEHDRDGYTEAKTEFIRHYTEKARQEYKGRY